MSSRGRVKGCGRRWGVPCRGQCQTNYVVCNTRAINLSLMPGDGRLLTFIKYAEHNELAALGYKRLWR